MSLLPARPKEHARLIATNVVLALALASAVLLKTGAVRLLLVSSVNMVPTLDAGDRVMVRGYGAAPARGDVVVYRSPFEHGRLEIGRVVALAGDRVELDDEGLRLDGNSAAAESGDAREATGATTREERLAALPAELASAMPDEFIAGELIAAEAVGDHRYFTRRAGALSSLQFPPLVVPDGRVFVLNDNRVDERDSRIYGPIPRSAIVGVASFVYYAFDETGIRWDRMSRRVS